MLVTNQGWTIAKVSDEPLELSGVFVHDERRNHNGIMTVINDTIYGEKSHLMVKGGTFLMEYAGSAVYLSVTNSHVTIGFKVKKET